MEANYKSKKPNSLLLRIIVNTLSVFVVAYLLPGIQVESFVTALIIAVLMAVLNATLKPLLIVLTLPITILTLGFFLMVINALVILLVANWVDGFTVTGFWWAVLFSILISIVNSVLYGLGGEKA